MNYLLYLYILPAIIFLISMELLPDSEFEGKNVAFVAIIPAVNFFMAMLMTLLLFCRFMMWVKNDDQ